MKRISILLALAGLAVSALLVVWLDAGQVLDAALSVGWQGFLILALCQMALFLGLGLCWVAVLPGVPPGLLIWGRMVRDAAGNCLPFSHVGGYVVGARAVMVGGVTWPTAAASTVVDVSTEVVSQLIFTLFGLAVLALVQPGSQLVAPVGVGLALAAAALVVIVWFRGDIWRMLRGLSRRLLGDRFAGREPGRRNPGRHQDSKASKVPLGGLARLERELARLYRNPRGLLVAVALHVACWFGSGITTWISLRLLGWEADLLPILALEALIAALIGAAFIVPGGVGVQEAGFVGLGAVFGVPPEIALSVSLLRRARDLALGVPILLVFQWIELKRLK